MEIEVFKPVKGHEDRYLVSNMGNVKSIETEIIRRDGKKYSIKSKVLRGDINKAGYRRMRLYFKNGSKNVAAYRMVATQFIPNPLNKPQINHKNGIKTDDRAINLEWCTAKENAEHAVKNDLYRRGSDSPVSILTEKDVLFIRKYKKGYYFEKDKAKRVTFKMMADMFGVNRSTIYAAYKGKTWSHL